MPTNYMTSFGTPVLPLATVTVHYCCFCFCCHDIIVFHGWLFSDVNECRQKPGICGPNSVCRNTQGGYQCLCRPGYIRKNDSCIGKNFSLFTLSEVQFKVTAFIRI